jgi:SAM-dependent methyltransferase
MNIASPIDVATHHTLAFVTSALQPRSTIIEVGAGAGHLAAALDAAGHQVLAIDEDADNVAAARARGVMAVMARWPDCAGTPADAIAFTRSLHHIAPLSSSVALARAMLKNDGRLIVEDFAHDRDERTDVYWLRERLAAARARGWLAAGAAGFVGTLLAASDPMDAWREHHVHGHGVHASGAMRAAIEDLFGTPSESSAPYLYRYAIPWLEKTREAAARVEAVVDDERRRIERGELRAIGLRFVASRTRRTTPSAHRR